MFNIGERVINSGRTAAPIQSGTISGIMLGASYAKLLTGRPDLWDLIFPDWPNKMVYFVDLDIPSAPVSALYKGIINDEFCFEKRPVLAFTEEDLRLFQPPEEF